MSLSIAVPLIVAVALLALAVVVARARAARPRGLEAPGRGASSGGPEAAEAAGPGPLLPPLLVLIPRLVH